MALPLRISLAGATDTSGTVVISVPTPASRFSVLMLTARCGGNPNWVVTSSNNAGQELAFGNGPQVSLGPFLTSPGEVLTITVTGSTPSAQVTGTLAGTQHADAEAAAASFMPSANAVTINTFQARQRLYPDGVKPATANAPSFTVPPPNQTATKRFTLPPGTAALRVMATANGLLFVYAIAVIGVQSVEAYFGNEAAPGAIGIVPKPTLPFTIPVERDWDSQVDITVQGDQTNSINFFVSALSAPEAPGQAGDAQSVFQPKPAFWQAGQFRTTITATSVAGAGGVLQIVPPQGARTIIFPSRFMFFQDGANALGRWTLEDTNNIVITDMLCNATRGLLAEGDLEGIGTSTANTGLQLRNTGGNPSFVSGHLDYQLGD